MPHYHGALLVLLLIISPAQHRPDPPRLPLELLGDTLAVCGLPPETPLPRWTSGRHSFLTITRTRTELSIVAAERLVPRELKCEGGYRAARVHGTLPLDLVGVVAAMAAPLAERGISLFAISTNETDYILVQQRDLAAAVQAWRNAGHTVADAR
jgi:hypothetical protein